MRLTPRALPLALTIALAVAGVVYLGGLRRPPTFEAVQLWTWTAAPPDEAAPYLQALASAELRAAAVAGWLGRAPRAGEVDAVRRWLTARTDPAGIRVVVRGGTQAEAEERAAAVAEAFAAWSIAHVGDRLESSLANAQSRVEEATERVRTAQVLGSESDVDVETLLRERDAAIEARDAALAALATGSTMPLEPRAPVVRSRPSAAARNAVVSGVVAGLLGLLAGLRGSEGTAAAARRRAQPNPSQRGMPAATRTREAPPSSDASALARFPATTGDDVPALRSPAEALARAVAALDAPAPIVVLVVSVASGEGKTTVACHLAEALTRAGRRTLLVDASLWSPALAARYALTESPKAGEARIASTLDWMQRPLGNHKVVGVDLGDGLRLDLVPQFRATRPAPGTADALFGAFGDALGRWRGYDAVVVDTAALDAVDDTNHLAAFATAAVVVADVRSDGRRRREEARRRLRDTDVPILGFVLNEPHGTANAASGSAGAR